MDRKIIGGAAAFTAAMVAAGGVYLAMPASATPAGASTTLTGSPQAKQAKQAKRGEREQGRHRAGPRRKLGGLHGEATVRRKGEFVRVGYQRGSVTAASATAITVRSLDGTTWQWTIDADARIRRHGEKSKAGAVAKGDWTFVAGSPQRDADVVIVPRKAPAKASAAPSAD